MIFPNYYKMMSALCSWSSPSGMQLVESSYSGNRYSYYTLKNLSGTSFNAYNKATQRKVSYARNTIINVMRMNYNYRIALGTGDNTYTGDEYCLANDISSSFSNLAYSYASEVVTTGNTKLARTITVTGTNSSNESQTITELAYIKKIAYDATNFYEVLYAICTLDEPITVAAGANFTALFKWDTQFNGNTGAFVMDNWFKLRNIFETQSDVVSEWPMHYVSNTGIMDIVNYEVSPSNDVFYEGSNTEWVFGYVFSHLGLGTYCIGTGNNDYTGAEYALANDITSEFKTSSSAPIVFANYRRGYDTIYTDNSVKMRQHFYLQNTSQEPQTVTEIGLLNRVPELDGTYDRKILIAIYKLDAPIIVQPGESVEQITDFEIA